MGTCETCRSWEPIFEKREGVCPTLEQRLDFGMWDEGCVEDVYTPHDFGCTFHEEK